MRAVERNFFSTIEAHIGSQIRGVLFFTLNSLTKLCRRPTLRNKPAEATLKLPKVAILK